MSQRHHRKRRHRRTAKQALRHGPKAKRAHKKIGGRTGSIRTKSGKPNAPRKP